MNTSRLKELLAGYKKDFPERWRSEKYRWEAIRCFRDNWDATAPDFAEMLRRSLEKTGSLLASPNSFPRSMIVAFANAAEAETRGMFAALYDESADVYGRIKAFVEHSGAMLEKYGNGAAGHYQDGHSASVYLWLRYPDKYYIYDYHDAAVAAAALDCGSAPGGNDCAGNVRAAFSLYDAICGELKHDGSLAELLRSQLDGGCYPDPELKTLTCDFARYISSVCAESGGRRVFAAGADGASEEPAPHDYSPGLTVEDWCALLGDGEVFDGRGLEIMRRMKDCGGQASYASLAEKYGETRDFYRDGSLALAKRIVKKTGCPVDVRSAGDDRRLRVLYITERGDDGAGTVKLRGELAKALERVDLSGVPLYSRSECGAAPPEPYTKADFLSQVYMAEERYETLVALLKEKQNIILQGAPGVGKTYTARRLAWSLTGVKNDKDRVCLVQFHQNYSYEDFVMGYKPAADGFVLKYGVFYTFCEKARSRPDENFYFIIDEINRGNLGKIFGELLMLIEKDYRGETAVLAYNGQKFSVPENLYIIGMMNTADRSLAMIDYALRRRFGFFEMEPGFDTAGFARYQKELNSKRFDALIEKVKELNRKIAGDRSLGKGFCIGHSCFCGKTANSCTDEWLRSVVEFNILPTLSEYWFDDGDELRRWEDILRGVFK